MQIQIQTRYEAWEGENLSELSSSPKWWGYFLCGVRGVQEEVTMIIIIDMMIIIMMKMVIIMIIVMMATIMMTMEFLTNFSVGFEGFKMR